jgi:nucleotide-binding universal stress UspA family protein
MNHLYSNVNARFRLVLYATNFPADYEGALQTTLNFCQTNKAKLHILHVCKPDIGPRDINAVTDQDAILVLRQMEERATEFGLSCTTRLALGVPAEKILQSIEEDKIDLVVLGTSDQRGSKRGAFGLTAEQVMRKSSCPIMTVGPVAADLVPTQKLKGSVVFATDFQSVTRQAVQVAVSYCKNINLQLRCLHVLPRSLQSNRRDHALTVILTSALNHLVATSTVRIEPPVCTVTFGSEISNSVVDYARQQGESLIFLGVRRDSIVSPDDSLPIVFRIITEAPCPVVTIPYADEANPEFRSDPASVINSLTNPRRMIQTASFNARPRSRGRTFWGDRTAPYSRKCRYGATDTLPWQTNYENGKAPEGGTPEGSLLGLSMKAGTGPPNELNSIWER